LIWELTNVDGTENNYATILNQGGNSCIVKTYGGVGIDKTIKLKAKLNSDYTIYKEFIITIEGIL